MIAWQEYTEYEGRVPVERNQKPVLASDPHQSIPCFQTVLLPGSHCQSFQDTTTQPQNQKVLWSIHSGFFLNYFKSQ